MRHSKTVSAKKLLAVLLAGVLGVSASSRADDYSTTLNRINQINNTLNSVNNSNSALSQTQQLLNQGQRYNNTNYNYNTHQQRIATQALQGSVNSNLQNYGNQPAYPSMGRVANTMGTGLPAARNNTSISQYQQYQQHVNTARSVTGGAIPDANSALRNATNQVMPRGVSVDPVQVMQNFNE